MAGFSEKSVSIAVLVALLGQVSANVFLGNRPHSDHQQQLHKETVEQTFLSELSSVSKNSQSKIAALEHELQPLYQALPKNEKGKLEASTVRYALHRHFALKFGWHVKGLERAGGSWNESFSSSISVDETPSYILALFEQHMHGEGLGLHELAVFAATVSDLAGGEAIDDLMYVYGAMGVPTDIPLPPTLFDDLAKTYLVALIYGIHEEGSTAQDFKEAEKELAKTYLGWADSLAWLQDLREGFDLTERHRRSPFTQGISWKHAEEFVHELRHRFGAYQDLECRAQKNKLLDLEEGGSGRVRLSRFYSGSHNSEWSFIESVDYLRSLGALDESDPARPSVIIPNYLNSKSNCVTPSSFYSVCCLDECEGLLAQVERAVAGPAAEPAQVAQVISTLESDTVWAPRNLSTTLLARLQIIADHHGGVVPLHGRLFSQWMHHAYPQECAFPHAAKTTNPLTPDEWLDATGQESTVASDDEMSEHLQNLWDDSQRASASIPWIPVEELVSIHQTLPTESWLRSQKTRMVMLVAVIVCTLLPLVRSSGQLTRSLCGIRGVGGKREKCLV